MYIKLVEIFDRYLLILGSFRLDTHKKHVRHYEHQTAFNVDLYFNAITMALHAALQAKPHDCTVN